MITHRNAWMNCVGMLTHTPMTPADTYLWTLPMFHANGWTFTWTVTAAGARHICLPKFDGPTVFQTAAAERVTRMCAAPTVLIMLANAPAEAKALAPKGVGVMTAGAPPAAVTIQRIEEDLGWNVIQIYGLTETAPAISISVSKRKPTTMKRNASRSRRVSSGSAAKRRRPGCSARAVAMT